MSAEEKHNSIIEEERLMILNRIEGAEAKDFYINNDISYDTLEHALLNGFTVPELSNLKEIFESDSQEIVTFDEFVNLTVI